MLWKTSRHCTSLSLSLQSELVVVDRGGMSESNKVPSLAVFTFISETGGVRGLSREVCARVDSLSRDAVSLRLSQQLDSLWVSFGGQFYLSGVLIVTSCVSGCVLYTVASARS